VRLKSPTDTTDGISCGFAVTQGYDSRVPEPSTRLQVRVVPGADRDAVVGRYGDGWKIRVAAPPERGAANRAVVRLLADALSLPGRSVAVVTGGGARDKIVELRGIAPREAESRLAALDGKERRR
jgi:uncharacterized protein YggU (UPF0235/DUF167 family)